MLANGNSKAPKWLLKAMPREIEIIGDIDICKTMGWTFTELDDQPFFEVQVLRRWLHTVDQAQGLARKRAEKKAAPRGRGRRPRRRGRRR